MGQSDPNESKLPPQPPIRWAFTSDGGHDATKYLQENNIPITGKDTIEIIAAANEAWFKKQQVLKDDKRT